MLTKSFVKQKFIHFALLIGASLLFLTACNSGNNVSGGTPAPTSAIVTSAGAIIKHSPSGTVELMWDNKSHVMTVHLALTGLASNSTHASHIGSGSCKNPGSVVYSLSKVSADAIGFANAITKVANVSTGIPETGWYIDVVGTSNSDQTTQITCANVFNPSSSTNSAQNVQVTLMNSSAPNQDANGTAQLVMNNNHLTVTITVKGLAPNTQHAVHMYSGSCASQGKEVYQLKPLLANSAGSGTSVTTIAGVSGIQRSGWYVNIYQSGDLKSANNADPVACGDITALQQ